MLVISGLAFGALTINIFRLVAANWRFITTYGSVALREGGLQQSAELLFSGIIAMIFYVLFKFSENVLVTWLKDRKWSRSVSSTKK